MKDLSHYRKDYSLSSIKKEDLPKDPLILFEKWFEQAERKKVNEPNAMTLSTIDPNGHPRSRVVLLKSYSFNGFLFFTNYNSIKGQSILKDNRVCLSFFWKPLQQQIIIQGTAEKTEKSVSERYFSNRPQLSKIAAMASRQSEKLISRKELNDRFSEIKRKYKNKEITCPDYWGGFLVRPTRIEFWQGRKNRMHDRIEYLFLKEGTWMLSHLSP